MTRAFRSHAGHGEMAASAAPVISPRAGADPGQILNMPEDGLPVRIAPMVLLRISMAAAIGELTVPVTGMPGAWIISNQTITPSGRVFVLPNVAACNTGAQQQCNTFLANQHLRRQISYQPASRFWALQAYETAIFLALALALAGFCVWWIRRRRLA
jgi:hypothetical protein